MLSIYNILIAILICFTLPPLKCYSIYDWPVDIHIWALLTKVHDTQLTVKSCGPLDVNFICLFIKISIIVNILNSMGLIKFYFFHRFSASTQQSTWSLEITLPHDPLLDRLIDRWCVQRVSVLLVCCTFEIYRWYINIYHIEIFNISFINRYYGLLLLYYVIIQLEQHFDIMSTKHASYFPNPIMHRWSSNFTILWFILHSSRTSQKLCTC